MNRRVDRPPSSESRSHPSRNISSRNQESRVKPNTKKSATRPLSNQKGSNSGQSSWFASQVSLSSVVGSVSSVGSLPLYAWLAHHRFSCIDSLQRLLATPWQSMLTGLVVAIALVLPALLYLAFDNIRPVGEQWQSHKQISLYIQPKAQSLAVEKLRQRLAKSTAIANVKMITPDMAKQDFLQYSGLGSVLSSLDSNPLPYVLTVQAAETQNTPRQLEDLLSRLAVEPLVESAQLDMQWLRRLQEMMDLAQRVVLSLAALLAVGVVLIIGNTIRLSIENRRNEIVVIKMVGGTDGFVKRPFLYSGFWYGVVGAILALLLLGIAELWLSVPIQRLAILYDSEYTLSLISLNISGIVVIAACALGWVGAWLSVSRQLKQIEPE
ncbi:MAG: cell division transport system permease protein [Candidatus Endobugula sp.]|jgi:cell division transport system permease protein